MFFILLTNLQECCHHCGRCDGARIFISSSISLQAQEPTTTEIPVALFWRASVPFDNAFLLHRRASVRQAHLQALRLAPPRPAPVRLPLEPRKGLLLDPSL